MRNKIRGRGAGDLFSAILRKLRTALYLRREFIVFCGDMSQEEWYKRGDEPPHYSPTVDVEIRLGKPEDLDSLTEVVGPKKIALFKDWFSQGLDLFIAFYKGRVVYYQWLTYNDFFDDWNQILLTPARDEVIPVDIYTLPRYRNKMIHLAAQSITFAHCRELGRFKMIATTSPEKFPLLKLMNEKSKFGRIYQIKKGIYYRYLGFIKRHVYEDNPQ